MKILLYLGIGISSVWLQLTVAPLLEVWGTKPNLVLVGMLAMGIFWMEPWLFIYAALAGLALDVFSHGILGIYGLSFFCVSFLARIAGASIYENNMLFALLSVFGLSLGEGMISLALLNILDSSVPWWFWLFTQVVPNAVYNTLVAPVLFMGFMGIAKKVKFLEL